MTQRQDEPKRTRPTARKGGPASGTIPGMPNDYPILSFDQFPSHGGKLLMFAAPAKVLFAWAGIPRKGWHVRMLYQRGVAKSRERGITMFWNQAIASRPPIVGPTAITVALQRPPIVENARIQLPPAKVIDPMAQPIDQLATLAAQVMPVVAARLDVADRAAHEAFLKDPLQPLPEVHHDYVFEFALQLAQMAADAKWFVAENRLGAEDVDELVVALEAICRPALVVDGQHRLFGAAKASQDVLLPCVAIPDASWLDQIYQFIVINERAEPISPPVLTDIFGSSLTRAEQNELRTRLGRAGVEVEARVAAVIAGRHSDSPFYNMIRLRLEGSVAPGPTGFISDTTVRLLIEGRTRGAMGWRTDDSFYNTYVRPTFPSRDDWDRWDGGLWRDYWLAFWSEVRDFYNAEAAKTRDAPKLPLWSAQGQSNLTKAVTLRLLQRLFMERAIARIQRVEGLRSELVGVLGPELTEQHVAKRVEELAMPNELTRFRADVRSWFLEKGIPVRVFLKNWVASLDDDTGRDELYKEFVSAFDANAAGDRYHARNKFVFEVEDKD